MPVSLINEVLTKPDDRVKYETFALRSFVEDNRKMSWCTGEGGWGEWWEGRGGREGRGASSQLCGGQPEDVPVHR